MRAIRADGDYAIHDVQIVNGKVEYFYEHDGKTFVSKSDRTSYSKHRHSLLVWKQIPESVERMVERRRAVVATLNAQIADLEARVDEIYADIAKIIEPLPTLAEVK